MEEHLRKSGEDRDDLEKAIDRLRLDLAKTEKKKKDRQHQVCNFNHYRIGRSSLKEGPYLSFDSLHFTILCQQF